MTLDEKYFELRLYEIYHNYEWQKDIKILHQIAKDAFEAGAEAQREMGVRAINDLIDNCGCCEVPSAEIVLAAINSATIKWEEK